MRSHAGSDAMPPTPPSPAGGGSERPVRGHAPADSPSSWKSARSSPTAFCPMRCSSRSSSSRSCSSTGRRARRCGSRSCCRTRSGSRTDFIWFENYRDLFAQADYYRTIATTVVFSSAVALLSLSIALLLAAQADKQLKGAGVYRTLLIWPYAVAPAVAGVLWLFMFQPSLGVVARGLRDISASTGTRCSTATTP